MKFIIAQAIGFIGTGLLILSYQCKNNNKLFFMQMCANVAYIIHFILLNALTGSVAIAIGLVRNALLCSGTKFSKNKIWPVLITICYIVSTIMTWKDYFSIFPCIAMIAPTIAGWTFNAVKIRLANLLFNSPCWLIYDLYTMSMSGVVCEAFSLCSIIVSFMRYGFNELNTKQ